ncbi:ankyrin [Dothidotthia symphoricarpi CBS 119687]|uniref:Ankyrin n=1 Tax=Dothidotthia symphoricarpi CBS 119687 TaxID=1392245 RepID=A0A6A5ZZ88_9PLEO|nr:ankyrin [Dothidotthia symphoricarpi CBS 119687]KAF2124067.1 ankyrin [Dothidotthia symphoricarpi CBS 119687]
MEVVGLVASIITLIGAASLTGSTLTRLYGLRGAPLYILTALNEVNDFKATLSFVHRVLDDLGDEVQGDTKAEIERLLLRAKARLDAFNKFLKEDVLREGENLVDNRDPKLRRRAKWRELIGEGQSQFDALQQELVSIKVSLGLTLSASQLRTIPKLFTSIQQITLVRPNDTEMTCLKGSPNADTAMILENIISASTSEAQGNVREISFPESSTTTGSNNETRLTLTVQQPTTYVKIETKLVSRRCPRRCPCQCHIPLQGSTPKWLKGLIGSAFVNFTGTPLLNHRSCNFKKCGNQDPGSGSARFQYFFPSWLLPLGIELTSSWRSLGGLGGTWTLRIPRICFDSVIYNKLFYLFEDRFTVEDLQKFMSSYGLRAFDCFDYDGGYETIFAMAVIHNRADVCNLLLDTGTELNHRSRIGFTLAEYLWLKRMNSDKFAIVRARPDLEDVRDNLNLSSVHDSAIGNQIEDLTHQVRLDASSVLSRDYYGFTPLHWAVRFAHLDIVDALLSAGADVNAVCRQGRSVISWAVESGSVMCCQKLLDAGAHVNILDREQQNVMLRALLMFPVNEEIVHLLVRAGTDVNHQDRDGRTSLMFAAQFGTQISCEKLLQYGADMEIQNEYGVTAVLGAVQNNNHDVLKLLCDRKAILNRKDRDGDSMIHYAAWFGDLETMRILEEAQIEGLPIDDEAVKGYWGCFSWRDETVFGDRAPIEEEKAAFKALLDSIIPSNSASEKKNTPRLPGAFPAESDDEQSEDEQSMRDRSEDEWHDTDDENIEESNEETDNEDNKEEDVTAEDDEDENDDETE